MARLAIAAAGAAIGSLAGPGVLAFGLTGAKLGFIAGSMLGGFLEPAQKSEGPRLTDLSVASSSYGTPIPYIQGHPRVPGQIWWASAKREIATTTSTGGGGKGGGGGSTQTTYTYEIDLLLGLTDNEIEAVTRIWINGKLVWSALAGSTPETLSASDNTHHWSRMTVYKGSATQLPDPDYEAAVGTANAPAYRGRGTLFIKSLGLGSGGQIPNITVEVATSAGFNPAVVYCAGSGVLLQLDASTGTTLASVSPGDGSSLLYDLEYVGGSFYALDTWGRVQVFDPNTMTRTAIIDVDPGMYPSLFRMSSNGSLLYAATQLYGPQIWKINLATGAVVDTFVVPTANAVPYLLASGSLLMVAVEASDGSGVVRFYQSDYTLLGSVSVAGAGDGIRVLCLSPDAATLYVSAGVNIKVIDVATRTVIHTIANPLPGSAPDGLATSPDGTILYCGYRVANEITSFNATSYAQLTHTVLAAGKVAQRITASSDGSLLYCTNASSNKVFAVATATMTATSFAATPTNYPSDVVFTGTGGTWGLLNETLRDVVDRLCTRAGMPAGSWDASALTSIIKPVRALALSQVASTRNALESLAACYFFEAVLSDKLYFRPRGGAAVAALAYDELGYSVNTMSDPLPLHQGNDLELPAQIALTYSNVDGDYQPDTQYSDRLLTGQESTSAMQVPLGFTASEAKQIADAMLMDRMVGSLSTTVSLGRQYGKLEASDVVIVAGDDGSTYRLRLIKKTDADGVLVFDAVLDDASVLTQAGVTSGITASQTVVAALPNTALALLDIPLLLDANDKPGFYAAVAGSNAEWTSAGLFASPDDVSYALDSTFTTQTVIGTCTSTLGGWTGGTVFDEANSVTVSVGSGELASVTREVLLSSQANAALIGSELVQFRTATLISAGVYTLTGLLRGRRGTDWAMTGHAASESFVLLGAAGMRFVGLQSGDLGLLRYYKAASNYQRLSAVTAQSITPVGVNLKPFSPVDCRADRASPDTALTWKRRTRLSTRFVGSLPRSIPLGEDSEAYEVDVYGDGTFTTVKRTLTSATPSVTYTNAQQVADFGSGQATLYLRVYQLSANVGRGYPLQATV